MFRNLLNLFYPPSCLICENKIINVVNYPVCSDCSKKIKPVPEPICQICGQPTLQTICYQCKDSPPFFTKARAFGIYEGVLKKSIHFFKYRKKKRLSRFLSNLLWEFLIHNPDWMAMDFLVPVPLNKLRLKERGYNQSEILSRELSQLSKIKLSADNLRRKGLLSSQVKSSRKERTKNVADSFYLNEPKRFYNKKILLIDDVFTTGSTVDTCSRVLKEAGAEEVLVLTVARVCI